MRALSLHQQANQAIIEVKSVIRNVDEQIKNEKHWTNIKKMFMADRGYAEGEEKR